MPKNTRKRTAVFAPPGSYPLNLMKPSQELTQLREKLHNKNAGLTTHERAALKQRKRALKYQLIIPFLNKQAKENAEDELAELNRLAGKGSPKRGGGKTRRLTKK
jgi:hypothetical protein